MHIIVETDTPFIAIPVKPETSGFLAALAEVKKVDNCWNSDTKENYLKLVNEPIKMTLHSDAFAKPDAAIDQLKTQMASTNTRWHEAYTENQKLKKDIEELTKKLNELKVLSSQ